MTFQAHYTKLLTNEEPDLRPTAKEVLEGEIFCTKDQIILSLRKDKSRDQDRISDLERQLRELTKENEKLKSQHKESSSSVIHPVLQIVCSKCENVEELD